MDEQKTSLTVSSVKVDTGGYGVPNCIISRPEGVVVKAGRRYRVEITGLETRDRKPTQLGFQIEFFEL